MSNSTKAWATKSTRRLVSSRSNSTCVAHCFKGEPVNIKKKVIKKMESKTIENGADAAMNLAHLSHEVAKAKTLLDDAIDEGKRKEQCVAKRSYAMAEDCIEDTTYYIKRHPWE